MNLSGKVMTVMIITIIKRAIIIIAMPLVHSFKEKYTKQKSQVQMEKQSKAQKADEQKTMYLLFIYGHTKHIISHHRLNDKT